MGMRLTEQGGVSAPKGTVLNGTAGRGRLRHRHAGDRHSRLRAGSKHRGPSGTSYTLLLGVFAINPLHNVIHLATGAIALAAGLYGSGAYARMYFLVFGIVYALITLIGVTG